MPRTLHTIGKARLWGINFPGGSNGKASTCSAGDPGSIPGSGRSPGGGSGNALQYSCLENPHGQRSLVRLQSMGSRYPERRQGWDQSETSPDPAGQRTSASGLKTGWFLFHLSLVAMGLTSLYSSASFNSLSQITVLSCQRGLHNSVKLWAMPWRATQDRRVTEKGSNKTWSTGGRHGKPLQYSCHTNSMNSIKRQTDMTIEEQVRRCPIWYWGRAEGNC